MFWTLAFAGVTIKRTFYEVINIDELVKSRKMTIFENSPLIISKG